MGNVIKMPRTINKVIKEKLEAMYLSQGLSAPFREIAPGRYLPKDLDTPEEVAVWEQLAATTAATPEEEAIAKILALTIVVA